MNGATAKKPANTDGDRNWHLYLRIMSYLKPYVRYIIMVLLFNFCFVIFNTLSVWMIAPVMTALFDSASPPVEQVAEPSPQTTSVNSTEDQSDGGTLNLNEWLKSKLNQYIYRDNRAEMLKMLCIFIFITFALKNFFAFGEFFWVSYVEQKVIKDLREEVYSHILFQPLQYFSKNQTGDLISRITNDINAVNVAVNRSFTKVIRDPILITLLLVLLFSISWKLTLLALIVFPVTFTLIGQIGKSLKRKSKRVQERISDITANLQEVISGIKVVKAFGMEDYEDRKFQKHTEGHFRAVLRQVRLRRLSSPLSETLGVGVMASVMWYGGQLVLSGNHLSPEDFIRFTILLFSVMDPVKSLADLNNNIQIALASGHRIFEVIDTPIAITDRPDAREKDSFERSIDYKTVSFKYAEDGKPVLRTIDLSVAKNQQVALVGGSGAGKTTLVNLLPRFYDVSAGQILIDGIDIRDIRIKDLRKMMGIVTQEVILFNDTIANNIAYGMSEYTPAQIRRAAELANALEFIEAMPEGFETMIGERGVRLSGGQRQRISIARAILKNPPILIFDEATSSLDSESEHLIQAAIENLMKDRTVFMIAHRLSSIIHCDKIFVMDNGKLLDAGTHEELLQRSKRYQRLCKLQFTG